jgi:hypothetical protein
MRTMDSTRCPFLYREGRRLAHSDRSVPGGVTVYRSDGTGRFTALKGEAIRSAEAVGRYLYVRAGHRYAIDLLHGRVVGRVRSDARIARASFFRIPSPTCERR